MKQWKVEVNHWMGIVMMVVFFVFLFFILGGLFRILAWAAPVLLILALLINYRTVINFARSIIRLLVNNLLWGILAIVLVVLGFPLVAGYLFVRSLLDRKVRKLEKDYLRRKKGEFIEYEEVDEKDRLDLPNLPPQSRDSEYDDLFDEEKP